MAQVARRSQFLGQPGQQRRGQGDHVALDVLAEHESVHAHRRHELQHRALGAMLASVELDRDPAAGHPQQLAQVGVTVRGDHPAVAAAARGDRLAVHQVGRLPRRSLAVEREQRNRIAFAGADGTVHAWLPHGAGDPGTVMNNNKNGRMSEKSL
ncbi:hypothetical protein [Luteimonas sp. J16]|uniref:hypothetical protein n=1 Tax=Luteimonas sp. J16 TaxID=935283 RepID=UPI002106A8C2|nr:hypothetical protein [Luteimonas sp. J16]